MKTILLMSVVLISQISFAQKRVSVEEARVQLKKSATYEAIDKIHAENKDIESSPKLKALVTKAVENRLSGVTQLSATETNKIIQLLNVSPVDVMAQIIHLTSIVKDPTATVAEKSAATKATSLMLKSVNTVETVFANRDAASKAKVQAELKQAMETANKISGLKYGEKSNKFMEKYEKALAEGKSITEAVKIASEGKFTLAELLDCV